MSWLHLPFDLMKIQLEEPAEAAEELLYVVNRTTRTPSRPMQIILAALRLRARQPK